MNPFPDNDENEVLSSLEKKVIDSSEEEDQGNTNAKYLINSYGADYTVDSLVLRMDRKDIYIPTFQRSFVWTISQSSKFIESLLLGLPVPGIFLSKDSERRLVVIDGQQRLKSLQKFFDGIFDHKEFALKNVVARFDGRTYKTLEEEDRRQLNDSIIHATIVQQIQPEDNDSSIYHIFERLNTGGTKLKPQEIRASIYFGAFNRLLGQLNDVQPWRNIYGPENKYGKDRELILRFLALYYMHSQYQKPLNEFLNTFMKIYRELDEHKADQFRSVFEQTIGIIWDALGREAFRSQRVLNAAVFDAIMVGVAFRLQNGPITDLVQLRNTHNQLLSSEEFMALYTGPTTDEKAVASRLEMAKNAFSSLK